MADNLETPCIVFVVTSMDLYAFRVTHDISRLKAFSSSSEFVLCLRISTTGACHDMISSCESN